MDSVKVRKSELIETVTKNREAHRELFLKAQDGYRVRVIEELDKRLADARNGREIDIRILLQAPVDQTKDYDRVLRMLAMSVDEEITLDSNQFANYVLDDWQWSANARTLNSTYAMFAK